MQIKCKEYVPKALEPVLHGPSYAGYTNLDDTRERQLWESNGVSMRRKMLQ